MVIITRVAIKYAVAGVTLSQVPFTNPFTHG